MKMKKSDFRHGCTQLPQYEHHLQWSLQCLGYLVVFYLNKENIRIALHTTEAFDTENEQKSKEILKYK